jgi:RNA polymerase sigma-70 factor (ECF subfamily)
VTFNAALMRLRTRRRKGADSLDALGAGVAEALVQRAAGDDGVDADELLEARDRRAAVREALTHLKPQDQQLMRLRYGDDLDTDDVAALTGMSASAVKTRLHRARNALRDVIADDVRFN